MDFFGIEFLDLIHEVLIREYVVCFETSNVGIRSQQIPLNILYMY